MESGITFYDDDENEFLELAPRNPAWEVTLRENEPSKVLNRRPPRKRASLMLVRMKRFVCRKRNHL